MEEEIARKKEKKKKKKKRNNHEERGRGLRLKGTTTQGGQTLSEVDERASDPNLIGLPASLEAHYIWALKPTNQDHWEAYAVVRKKTFLRSFTTPSISVPSIQAW